IQDFFKDFSNLKPFKRESLKSKLQEIDFPKKIRRIKEGIDNKTIDMIFIENPAKTFSIPQEMILWYNLRELILISGEDK
ncbi:MAG: hypothetical protein ACP5JL_07795, partial [bacterium]